MPLRNCWLYGYGVVRKVPYTGIIIRILFPYIFLGYIKRKKGRKETVLNTKKKNIKLRVKIHTNVE